MFGINYKTFLKLIIFLLATSVIFNLLSQPNYSQYTDNSYSLETPDGVIQTVRVYSLGWPFETGELHKFEDPTKSHYNELARQRQINILKFSVNVIITSVITFILWLLLIIFIYKLYRNFTPSKKVLIIILSIIFVRDILESNYLFYGIGEFYDTYPDFVNTAQNILGTTQSLIYRHFPFMLILFSPAFYIYTWTIDIFLGLIKHQTSSNYSSIPLIYSFVISIDLLYLLILHTILVSIWKLVKKKDKIENKTP